MTKLNYNQFSSLLLAVNFQELSKISNTQYDLTYRIYEYRSPAPASLVPVTSKVSLISKNTSPILALAANFTPLPMCNPTTNQKYTGSGAACSAIASCNLVALFAIYCSDENKPLICTNNYYFDPLTQTCAQACSGTETRSPATITTNSICNYPCTNTGTCPKNSFAELSNLPANYLCSGGFNRMGYKCTNVAAKDSKIFLNF